MVFISPKIGTLKVGSIVHVHVTVLYYRLTDVPHQANHTLGVPKQARHIKSGKLFRCILPQRDQV
jgi:hypothetical protein